MSRKEHLEWCKRRAMAYVEAGDNGQAITSMLSDLSKHPETIGLRDTVATLAFGILMLPGQNEVRKFIEGFQ